MSFVIDASVALGWCFSDGGGEYAEKVLQSLAEEEAVAPGIWAMEVCNALLVGERRGRLTVAETTEVLGLLARAPISISECTMPVISGAVLSLARSENLSVYDACYVELALRNALPFATLDNRLRAVATKLGIRLHLA